MNRFLAVFLFALTVLIPQVALAQVMLAFHSFNGSYLGGRYPHAFIVLDGTLANGTRVHENYGYSTSASALSDLSGPVPGIIQVEKEKYIASTNRHFTVAISDAQYREIVAEVNAWKDAPGQKRYLLDQRNCIHFVARIAQIVGLKSDVPQKMVRRPKLWLNQVTRLNPHLGAKEIK
ncbi:hypothetical protein [Novosphingobium sp.]|uniref:hypothetical protein n=1 Tax=Novosphingobium sp. TaxID=1874826 RepID=UPI00286EB2D1|nr:hypothetical protein [Novosphingobium sp.]